MGVLNIGRQAFAILVFLASTAALAANEPHGAPQQAPGVPPAGQPIPNLPKLPSVNQEAYRAVSEEASPLTPDQIRALRRMVDEAERAAAAPPRFVPKPVSTSVTALLTPGATPPVIRLSSNFVSSLLFLDQSGNPLNIIDVTTGGAGAFTITWSKPPEKLTNKVDISPNSTYATGNVSVLVEGTNNTPISLTLVSGQREVDYRVDVRVKGRFVSGSQSASGVQDGVSPTLMTLLDGVAPDGARPLVSSSGDVQAWHYRNRFYVRTGLTLLSPAYINTMRSADGTAVYEIPPISALVVLAGGITTQVNLSGY